MYFTNKNAAACCKGHITGLILGITAALAAAGLLVFLYLYSAYRLENAVPMTKAYELNSQKYVPDRVVYIDTEHELYELAMRGSTEVYDVVFSTDGYSYILFLDSVEEIRINQSVNDTGRARIYGVTSEFKNETVRLFALEALQKSLEDNTVCPEDVESYLGYMQLNVAKPAPISLMAESGAGYWISILLLIVAAVYLIRTYLPRCKRWESINKEEAEAIEAEISRDGTAWMPNIKVYASDESIISLDRGVQVMPYSDILMIFVYSRVKDMQMHDEIKVLNKYGVVYTIANIPARLFKSDKVEDIWYELKYLTETAKTKNPNIYMAQNNAHEDYNQKMFYDLLNRAKSGEFV